MDKSKNKLWILELMSSSEMFVNKPLRVALYLLNNRNKEDIVITTIKKISEDLNISERTVISTLNTLKNSGLISMIQKGVYKIEFNLLNKKETNQLINVDRGKLKELKEKREELKRLKKLYPETAGKTKKNIKKKIKRLEKEIISLERG